MSPPDTPRRARPSAGLALSVLIAVSASLFPLLSVISPGSWTAETVGVVAVVLAAGFLARCLRIAAVLVSLIEVTVWLLAVTVLFGGGSALLGLIPTPETIREVPLLLDAAMHQIRDGAAPLDAGTPLAFLVVAASGLLAIGTDHVVMTARMPLLAGVGLLAVYLIPSIAVPSGIHLGGFVAFGASLLLLLAFETGTRERVALSRRVRSAWAATAVGVGASAIVLAVWATPLLPVPGSAATTIIAVRGNSIDPSLELGRDLRRPQDVEVLRLRSDAPTTPYLRAVTLSSFDGREWKPDRGIPRTLGKGFDSVVVDQGVRVREYTANIEVRNFVSPWLPVPFPAVRISGLDGEWAGVTQNRTVLSRQSSPQGQDYDVSYQVPRPTLEQIRAGDARAPGASRALHLPVEDEAVALIREQARAVTATTSTDYDALAALQRWFRGAEFTYSLDAPVEDGFDGSGLEAVQRFLQERSGYCVHYASAFAIMARALDMPSRIVVGYLPGIATGESVDRQAVYSVVSSQLHAWPEVHFEGIGWVPFEPTNSLGTPTVFASSASSTPADAMSPEALGEPAAPPSSPAVAGETGGLEASATAGSASTRGPAGPLLLALATLLLLSAPAIWRTVRRRAHLSAVAQGCAVGAWAEVIDTAADLGLPRLPAESPRALGRRLVEEAAAPPDAMAVVVGAIERASYAPPGGSAPGSDAGGPALTGAVAAVRAGLIARASRRDRLSAAVAPRSLLGPGGRATAARRTAR